ncbi:hypothetical protein BGX28_002316, partial [Mortierella sp. GBA30]
PTLVMLGLEMNKQATANDGRATLHSIVEGDIGKLSSHRVVAMVAPSGSGKTATVIDLATKHFVIYCVCSTPGSTVAADFGDPNFVTLAKNVERMYRTIVDRDKGGKLNPLDIDSEVKTLAGERVELEFLARLLFLLHLLNSDPDLEPRQFFREQTTKAGASVVRELVKELH